NRLQHRADGGFHLVHARVGWDPTRLYVQQSHAAVVAVKHGQEVFRQGVLIAGIQSSHDAEVDRGITRIAGGVHHHEDVAGVHVRMKEVVAEHLGEEDADAVFSQQRDVGSHRLQSFHVADGDAVYALHHHHVDTAVVPIDLRDVEEVGAGEIAFEL